ncbi:EamA family transporter [Streptomyces sp. HC307]|uniref:EamA family transporter n=1 Tax=Streptomyces flavusporus TaxID=3385496 RepID=UPI003916E669
MTSTAPTAPAPPAASPVRAAAPAMAATVCAMVSVQTGASLAVPLFDRVSPAGTAWLRLSCAAVLLLVWTRPRIRRLPRRSLGATAALGCASAVMTLCSFQAIDRLPLGTVSAVEFTGPLLVAVVGSRRRADLVWPLLALGGVLLLTRPWEASADWLGIGYALGAATGLGSYIVLTQRVGDRLPGQQGVALSTAVAALCTGVVAGGGAEADWWSPHVLVVSALAAVLLPIAPHVLELFALRRLTAGAFGTLMSLEPAVATGIGFLVLAQTPDAGQLAGVVLVCVAGTAACRSGTRSTTPTVTGPIVGQPDVPRSAPRPSSERPSSER